MDMIYDEMKKWEKQFDNGFVSFKAGKQPEAEPENPICAGIEALTITYFNFFNKKAKIKPIFKISGCYCPFCGVKKFELE